MSNYKKRILVIAAHPDDEVLGCGGMIAKLVQENIEVHTLILGEGPFSRYTKKEKRLRQEESKKLKASIGKAAKTLGVKKTHSFDFPDNSFDTVPLLDIVRTIEKVKNAVKPEAVYTHHKGDLNIDHKITYNAVLTACRPVEEETVKEIYSFEVPSSTEWNYPNTFSPNIFMDISGTLDKKIRAFKMYEDEIRDFPHPRSEEGIRTIAKRWGSTVGLKYSEAFEVVRIVR